MLSDGESGIFDYEVLDGRGMERLQKQSNAVYGRFTESERETVDDYTVDGFTGVNDSLFDGIWRKNAILVDSIDSIDSAISKFELKDDIVTFRGTSAKHYTDWNVGDVKTFNAYMSTSLSEDVARDFARTKPGSIMLEINIPKGTPGLYIGSNSKIGEDEKEFLLGRGQRLKVLERTEKLLKLEVIHE